MDKLIAMELVERLFAAFPDAKPELDADGAFECLVATVLAAQCTDARVNTVMPGLLAKWPDAAGLAVADVSALEEVIRPCGLFKSKAANLIAAARRMVEVYGGQVPGTLAELRTLPGVGNKTSNVVYANAFGGDAIAVDTHVFRVSNRTGLAPGKTPDAVETGLREVLEREVWSRAHLAILLHGRRVCRARAPSCAGCGIADLCGWSEKLGKTD